MIFDLYIGIDYSGAKTAESRLKGLQVYAASDGQPERVIAEPEEAKAHWNWSRKAVAEYLIGLARAGTIFIAGIDHGFGFPKTYFQQYALGSWAEFLEDFVQHWPTHEPYTYVDFVREKRPARTGRSDELRLCEKWTSSARSVFKFDVQGQVAKSTHAGIPWLKTIRDAVGDRVHFWPFDGWDVMEGKSVIAESYPSIFRHRYPKQDRSPDEQDAYSVARWLRETCERGFLGRYFVPPLTDSEREIAMLEGWILGIA